MSIDWSKLLLDYRKKNSNENGKPLSQMETVKRLQKHGYVALETYQKWERGVGPPNEENKIKLEKFLNSD